MIGKPDLKFCYTNYMTIIALYKQANASDFNTPSPVGAGGA